LYPLALWARRAPRWSQAVSASQRSVHASLATGSLSWRARRLFTPRGEAGLASERLGHVDGVCHPDRRIHHLV
jgi:hypothetical protein